MKAAERAIKPKACKSCRELFTPFSTLAKACSPVCALALVRKDTDRLERARLNAAKKAHRTDKERIKTRGEHASDAQVIFNQWVRLSQVADGCISCDRGPEWNGQWHASHYLSIGARPELRFEPLNVHKACSICNNWLSGNIGRYKTALIKKIGFEAVEWLEGAHPPKKYTIDDLKAIKAEYRLKLKELKHNNQSV